MRTFYLDCGMGATGDILMTALLELVGDKAAFLEEINGLGLPGMAVSAVPAVECGITGTHVAVAVHGEGEVSCDVSPEGRIHHHDRNHEHGHEHSHEHEHGYEHEHHHRDYDHGHRHHTGMGEIRHLLDHLELPEAVRADAETVYGLIAEAEDHAHGAPVEEIHFHEVDSLGAVADVAGIRLSVHMLGVERIMASPVYVGSGQTRYAHGILPVPAPTTVHILRDVLTYGGAIHSELCTSTGMTLLKHSVTEFDTMSMMKVEKIDYGMGDKDFEAANCVRTLLGETAGGRDEVTELCCNLDDTTTETIDFAQEGLLAAGALDVCTAPVGMKKGRLAVLLSCMCRIEDRKRLLGLLFRHTTTLGVRENVCRRYTLKRGERTVDTPHGPVRLKTASVWGVVRSKPEYKDVAHIAHGQGISLAEVFDQLK